MVSGSVAVPPPEKSSSRSPALAPAAAVTLKAGAVVSQELRASLPAEEK